MYPPNVTHLPTKNVWLDLIDEAQTTIEIASFYWSLRYNEDYPYNSSIEVGNLYVFFLIWTYQPTLWWPSEMLFHVPLDL